MHALCPDKLLYLMYHKVHLSYLVALVVLLHKKLFCMIVQENTVK